jgi:hypothetical protein
MKHTPRIRAMFVMLEPRRSPSETGMFPMTIAFMATNSSGSDVEKATKRKLSTDLLSLRFSDTVIKLDMTTPLDPPSNTSPIASNSGDGKIIREHVHS